MDLPFTDKQKERKLTPREAKFFKILAENPTITIAQAGREAGYAETTCLHKLHQKLGKVGNPLQKALEKAGITEKAIAERMAENILAYKTTRFNAHNGDTHEYIKEHDPDFKTRISAVELVCKIRGDLSPEQEAPNKTSISINNVVIGKDIDINQAVQIYQDTINNIEEE